jgi:dolichol-phosphate mannosyltransferase
LVTETAGVLEELGRSFEILVVNDNSADDTEQVLGSLEAKVAELHPLHRRGNRGVGNALRAGFKAARGSILVTMDGDLSHDPREISKLLDALADVHIVCGSRYTRDGGADMSWSRVVVSRFFNEVVRWITGLKIADVTSGFRAIRREVIDSITLENGEFGIYIEIPLKAVGRGFIFTEVPINYRPRKAGMSKLSYLRQGPEYLKVLLRSFRPLLLSRATPHRKPIEIAAPIMTTTKSRSSTRRFRS